MAGERTMSQLSGHVQDYLALRRALGFKLGKEGRLLPDFAAFAEAAGAATVTIDLALAWAAGPESASPVWAAQRLSMVRGLARYLQAVNPATQVPPAGLLPARTRRATPYIYSDAEVAALMTAARALPGPLKAATFCTLIGLPATTGMRGSEAMALDHGDLDTAAGLVTIRATKFRKSRQLPLHHSTLRALAAYQATRDRLCPAPATASLLVSSTGARLCQATVQPVFRHLLHQAGIGQDTHRPRATVHGLRHTFAVKTLPGWYRDGQDVQARLPALSTYLGHAGPAATYWYLTGTPELLALAAGRLEAAPGSAR
jgi:integrase/recombinase XerD